MNLEMTAQKQNVEYDYNDAKTTINIVRIRLEKKDIKKRSTLKKKSILKKKRSIIKRKKETE